jgi:hypothetical protein
MAVAATATAQDASLEMVVSPSTLNLESNGGCVTIHAVIGYSAVTDARLWVDGQPVLEFGTFPDSRGELVVRCSIETIKSMVSVGTATFDLTVHTQNGTYSGTDTIRVIDRGK